MLKIHICKSNISALFYVCSNQIITQFKFAIAKQTLNAKSNSNSNSV